MVVNGSNTQNILLLGWAQVDLDLRYVRVDYDVLLYVELLLSSGLSLALKHPLLLHQSIYIGPTINLCSLNELFGHVI